MQADTLLAIAKAEGTEAGIQIDSYTATMTALTNQMAAMNKPKEEGTK